MANQEEFKETEYINTTDEEILGDYQESSELRDAVKSYLDAISKYKLLSPKEFEELFYKYKNGDTEAKNKIIEHNLRLVVYVIKTKSRIKLPDQFLDLIQEGNLGLMRALEKYDINYGTSFSTYAYSWIRQRVQRNSSSDGNIRLPVYLKDRFHKLLRFENDYYNKTGDYPTDEEIKSNLKLNDEQLSILKHVKENISNLASLNAPVSDDTDSSELEDFVESNQEGYNDYHEQLSSKSLFYRIKNTLTSKEYFILYYRIYVQEQLSLEEIGNKIGVTRERVRQIETKALKKVKTIISKGVPDTYNIKESDLLPFPYEKTVILLYLKEYLTPYEYYILYNVWFKNIYDGNIEYIIDNQEEVKRIYKNILDKYGEILNNPKKYISIRDNVLSKYKSDSIFNMDIRPSVSDIKYFEQELYSFNHDKIMEILGDDYYSMSDKDQELIDNFFNPSLIHRYPSNLERELRLPNLIKLGYRTLPDKKGLPLKKLYNTFLENRAKFSVDLQNGLETSLFSDFTKRKEKVNEDLVKNMYYHVHRLEMLYYNLNHLFSLRIPENELLEILNDPNNNFDEYAIEYVKLKFIDGLETEEIANIYNCNKDKMRDIIWDAYDRVVNIALNRSRGLKIQDDDRYYEYIMNPNYEFTTRLRNVCKLFFIEHQSYEYIRDKLNIESTTKVSNMITESIRKMDFLYYGVTYDKVIPKYPTELIYEVLECSDFTLEEVELIISRYIDLVPLKTLSDKYNVNYQDLVDLMDDFNITYKEHFENYQITINDIHDELKLHISESVLTEEERAFASMYYGIKTKDNKEGKKYTRKELNQIFDFHGKKFQNMFERVERKTREHLLGYLRVNFDTFTRDELIELLNDPHLPISDFEIDLIKTVKGIGRKPLNYKDAAKKYKVVSSSVMRRLHRAYTSIKKYQENEIPGKLVYDIDIMPYIKYFPKFEQKILYQRFELGWGEKEFAKEYNLDSRDQANTLFFKIEKKLLYLMKYPDAKKYDFDYARKVLNEEYLPFYGNKEAAIKVYNRYFGDDGEFPETYNELLKGQGALSTSTLDYNVKKLMIAVMKYKDGIRKEKTPTREEVVNYYNKHKETMGRLRERQFQYAIKLLSMENACYRQIVLPEEVTYLLAKEKEKLFYTKDTPIDEIYDLLIRNPYHLTRHQLDVIRQSFNIPKRSLMTGKEKIKLFKLLEPYMLRYKHELENIRTSAIKDAKTLHESNEVYQNDDVNDVKRQSIFILSKSDERVLIADENLEIIYRYIINHVNNIDFLTKSELIKLLYMLEKYICLNMSFEEAKSMLMNKLSLDDIKKLTDLDPYIKYFFEELVRLNNDNIDFSSNLSEEEYIKRHHIVSVAGNNFLKCRMPRANVNFVDAIDGKYQEINLGRKLDTDIESYSREDIEEYFDALKPGGILLANFTPDNVKKGKKLFRGLRPEVIPYVTKFRKGTKDAIIKANKRK